MGIEAALAHGGPPCMLRLSSVGVAVRTANFTREVTYYDVANEAFLAIHDYFTPR